VLAHRSSSRGGWGERRRKEEREEEEEEERRGERRKRRRGRRGTRCEVVVIKARAEGKFATMIRVSFFFFFNFFFNFFFLPFFGFVDTTRFGSQQAAVVEITCMYRGVS
jgi:hypothetical protein